MMENKCPEEMRVRAFRFCFYTQGVRRGGTSKEEVVAAMLSGTMKRDLAYVAAVLSTGHAYIYLCMMRASVFVSLFVLASIHAPRLMRCHPSLSPETRLTPAGWFGRAAFVQVSHLRQNAAADAHVQKLQRRLHQGCRRKAGHHHLGTDGVRRRAHAMQNSPSSACSAVVPFKQRFFEVNRAHCTISCFPRTMSV